MAKARGGPTMDPKVLKEKAEERLALVVARLEAADKGVSQHTPAMVRHWRNVELPALLNGTWSPALKRTGDKKTEATFGLLARSTGVPSGEAEKAEAHVDDMIAGDPL